MIRLAIRGPSGESRVVSLSQPSIVGKSAECDVVLGDPEVSRRHARLWEEDGQVLLEDLGSTNGTTIAGAEARGRTVVPDGAEIGIGPFVLVAERIGPPSEPGLTGSAPRARSVEPHRQVAPPRAKGGEVPSYGPLDSLFADESVSEVMVNGPFEVYVERAGRIEETSVQFASEEELLALLEGIAREVGRPLDPERPMLDARLPDGSRVNAILPPLAVRGPYLTVRRFPKQRLSPRELVELGSLSESMLGFLGCAVAGRLNVLVSGGTGSGKTTLLAALCSFLGPAERIVTIEDAAELRLPQRHVLPLETRPPDASGKGEVTARDLLRNALRMRPDRIVVGEVRGGEALDMLQAMNTGHEGSLSTLHANSPREALARLETLVLFAGTDLPARAVREQIARAIRLLVHTSRTGDGRRRVTSISELTGMEGDQFTTGEIFRAEAAADGGVRFRATGYVPRCRDLLVERGQAVDNGWFRS
jgi:pilus assembly protein CpaF